MQPPISTFRLIAPLKPLDHHEYVSESRAPHDWTFYCRCVQPVYFRRNRQAFIPGVPQLTESLRAKPEQGCGGSNPLQLLLASSMVPATVRQLFLQAYRLTIAGMAEHTARIP